MASDCALLIAIPVDRREFDVDWERGTDFLRGYAARLHLDAADRVWVFYEPYSQLCLRTIVAVGDTVVVQRRATLDDFATAVAERAVVTLVAHSHDATVVPDDVADLERTKEALRTLRTHAADTDPPRDISVDQLVVALNHAIDDQLALPDDWHALPSSTRASIRVSQLTIRWKRRQAIERLSCGGLKPGVGVEFADGLRTIDTIDLALPATLPGTLDLTVCESVILADILRLRRSTGVILANADTTSADFRFSLYRETIALMRRRPHLAYIDAAMMLRTHLSRTICRP